MDENSLKEIGIFQFGMVSPNEIVFDEEIRKMCEQNLCRQYGKSWACPPAVGTVAECQKRCLSFKTGLVFQGVYPLEDSYDYEGMMNGHKAFKNLCDRLYAQVKERFSSFLLLSNEGCTRCEKCTYPEKPCRMPQMLFPSLEGFGIRVDCLAKSAGIAYHNGENTVTYFGMLLY